MVQVRLIISGLVQGVGFRYFIQDEAKKHQVTGWVRNLKNGNVEALLQGKNEDLEKLISLLKQGSFIADVRDVQKVEEEVSEEYRDFEIKYA